MRTKHVLMAMALPALFAACTSDEFMQEQPAGSLGNRPLLSADFTVDVEEAASTRFAWEDKNFKWSFEDGDQFGAAVTDPVTFGNISSESMLGNYIFGKGEDGKWRTNSQMVEGTYIYYSYEGFQNKSTRELVAFDLGTQNADLDDPTAVVNGKQLFFSPLYQIESETSNEAMPLQFYPYWSTAAFYIQNKTGQDLKITQIALEDATNEFVIKGHIDPAKLNTAALKYAYDKESGEYAIDAKAFEKANGKKTYDEVMQLVDLAVANDEESKTSAAIALNCGGYELADGESVTAYMVVPAHQAKTLKAKIVVVDEKGLSKQVTVQENKGTVEGADAIACTGISTRVFKRGSTYPVFGFNTDGKTMKALIVEKENLGNLQSFYVDNKADLLNVINNNLGAIGIYNFGDLAIDDEIAEAITKYTGTGITFDNAISVKCTGDATLEKTTFAEVTVESGNVTFGEDVVAGGKMVLKGGKLTLTDGTYKDADVTVEAGELVLNKANQAVKSIAVKGGIVTIAKDNKLSNIDLSFVKTLGEDGKEIATTLNVNAKLAADAALTTGAATTVNNASEITLTQTLTNNGIFNNGTATSDAAKVLGTGSFVNNEKATVNNYGAIKPSTVTNNANATVNNYKYFGLDASGNAITATNNGKIVMKNNTSRVYVSAGNGEIDNTAKGIVDAERASDMKIAVTISESMTNDEKLKELGDFNLLYLNGGTWTIEADAENTFNPEVDYAQKAVILNGGNIHLDDKGLTVASLHVAKNATISGGKDASQSKLTSNKYITAAATATLTAEFATVVATEDGKQLAVDMEGVYYLTSKGNIIKTGSEGKTVTYKALNPLTVNMGKGTVSAGGAKLVFGTNVTVDFTTGTGQYELAGTYTSKTAPADAEAAAKIDGLVEDINAILPNLATSEKVAVSDGAATASFNVEFAGSTTKTITVNWDGKAKAWVITRVADKA